MKAFEEQYKKALIEIEEKIKTSNNNKDLLFQLKKDREYILDCLFPKTVKKKHNVEFIEINKEVSDMIILNQLDFCLLSNVFFVNRNDKDIEKMFIDFIEQDVFGLKELYIEIMNNSGLIYTETEDKFWGRNIFIPSIKRNLIEIKKSNRLYESSSKIHELGHAKTNIESFCLPYVSKDNSFLESYSIFLELVFADYLKNNGKKKQGYELKFLIFQSIKDVSKQLYEEMDKYKEYSEERKGLKYFFELNYKTLKGYYLALYFYYLYQSNPKEALEIINNFIKEIKLLDDNEVVKKFNLNRNCFNRDNVYKLYIDLKQDKIKIKSRKAE